MPPPMKRSIGSKSSANSTSTVEYLTESAVEFVLNGTSAESLVNKTAEVLCPPQDRDNSARLHEFQIIKAVVLVVVTVIIMFSICKMVFQLFVQYSGKHDDR